MSEPNIAAQAGGFAADAAVDTTADGFINSALQAVEGHIPVPGGQVVDQMIQTEVDQVANNVINNEVNKGVGGILGDVEGLFGHHQ